MTYSKGSIVKGIVNKITGKGVNITIDDETWGKLPKSQMTTGVDANNNIVLSCKQVIEVAVSYIDEHGQISLSQKLYESLKQKEQKIAEREKLKIEKQKQQDLFQWFSSTYEKGSIFNAEITDVETKGVFIKIQDIEGFIPKEELNYNVIETPEEVVFVGESLRVVFLEYSDNKLIFSLKYLNEKPYSEELYDLSLIELLNKCRITSNKFIGQAKQYGKLTFIENLYTDGDERGRLLVDPFYGYNLRAFVPNTNFNVENGNFYKVEISLLPKDKRLERNQLFQFSINGNIQECENPYKKDIEETFSKLIDPKANVALSKTLEEVGKNMYSSKERMFFELVQNADDAASQNGVSVDVTNDGDFLIISHNGYSFDKDDFEAITSSANGTKKANENKTGYKGIGFKSVFTDSEQVYIKTGLYQFKFDKTYPLFKDFDKYYSKVTKDYMSAEKYKLWIDKFSYERQHFEGVKSIPWQLKPIWIEEYPVAFERKQLNRNVFIALKLGEHKISGEEGYCNTIENIISNTKFMLFLRRTKRIAFNNKTISKEAKGDRIILKNSFNDDKKVESFVKMDYETVISNEIFEQRGINVRIVVIEKQDKTGKILEAKFIDLNNREYENIPKKIAINQSSSISFAVPSTEEGGIIPNEKCDGVSMFAFLPTLVKDFSFPFYINANFILDPPRQRILGDNPWNFYLMQEIALKMVDWCSSLNEKGDKNALNILLKDYFDETSSADTNSLARHFNQSYRSALESEAFILGQSGKLRKQEEIIIDKTSTAKNPTLSQILGFELFCKILETEKELPSSNIDSSILSKRIFENIKHIEKEDIVDKLVENEDLRSWYINADYDSKEKLNKWLIVNEFTNIINSLPLFRISNSWVSINEISQDNNLVIMTTSLLPVKKILEKLGFCCSDSTIEECAFKDNIESQDESKLFEGIINRTSSVRLSPQEKLTLISTHFIGVGENTIKEIELFSNVSDISTPLGKMLPYRENAPECVKRYMICKEENFDELLKYLIDEKDEFNEVVWPNINNIDCSPTEIIQQYALEGQQLREIINMYNSNDSMAQFLPFVETSDDKTKEFFLNKLNDINIYNGNQYKEDSFEYRVLQIAANTLITPSEFSKKIYYGGICITKFSVKDEVDCEYNQDSEKKHVKFSLAKLLPQYQNKSDVIETIKSLFESWEELDKFFDTKAKSEDDVESELNKLLKIDHASYNSWVANSGNAQQYLFSVYRRKKFWSVVKGFQIDLSQEKVTFITDLLDFLFDKKIDIKTSPFTYHLPKFFNGLFFDNDYTFNEEQIIPTIEKWADTTEKKKYLFNNGVRDENSKSILFRKAFCNNQKVESLSEISDKDAEAALKYFAKSDNLKRPFTGENQKDVLRNMNSRNNKIIIEHIDNVLLIEKSNEWESNEYKQWQKEPHPAIFLYNGKIPKFFEYNKERLMNYLDGDYWYDENNKKLYINSQSNIDNLLFTIAKDNNTDFNMDDYQIICKEGKVNIAEKELQDLRVKAERVNELESEIKQLKEMLAEQKDINSTPEKNTPIMRRGCISLGGTEKKEAQIEAQKKLKEIYSSWSFPNGFGEGDVFSTFKIEDINGEQIAIVLKSHKMKDEPLKINPTEWDYLMDGAKLFIYTGDDIKELDPKYLIENQPTITLSFSTENLDIENRITALSNSLHYFKEMKFDFNSFNLSEKAKSIQEIYDKHLDGKQNTETNSINDL